MFHNDVLIEKIPNIISRFRTLNIFTDFVYLYKIINNYNRNHEYMDHGLISDEYMQKYEQ